MNRFERKTIAIKRYTKCGYACSMNHLRTLYTFVLADR
jgi:hypothetical protein